MAPRRSVKRQVETTFYVGLILTVTKGVKELVRKIFCQNASDRIAIADMKKDAWCVPFLVVFLAFLTLREGRVTFGTINARWHIRISGFPASQQHPSVT